VARRGHRDALPISAQIVVARQSWLGQFDREFRLYRRINNRGFQVKNAKRAPAKKVNQTIQQARAKALRALSDTALTSAKGGTGGDPPPLTSSDPIC